MAQVVIFGCGGFGREVLQIVRDLQTTGYDLQCVGFLVDPDFASPSMLNGLPVMADLSYFGDAAGLRVVVAIGNPAARRRVVERLQYLGVNVFPTIVHPRAWIGENVQLGQGVVICAGALLTTDIEIDAFSHINIGTSIGHDARIGTYCTLSPGVRLSGGVTLADEVELGSGAVLIPGVQVGPRCVIGAGAVVLNDIAADSLAVGVPAKVIRNFTWLSD